MWLLGGVEKGDFVCYYFACIIVLLVCTRLHLQKVVGAQGGLSHPEPDEHIADMSGCLFGG